CRRHRDLRPRYPQARPVGPPVPDVQDGGRGHREGDDPRAGGDMKLSSAARLASAIAWLILGLGLGLGMGCEGRQPEFAGVGRWRFTHTTLKDVTEGICQPTELGDGRKGTWCFAQTPFRIGSRSADVDLYFLGSEKTAELIEIQVKVRGCHEDELDQ